MHIIWLRAEPIFPLDSGNKIRSFNLLRGIAREEAVTYVGLRHDDGLIGQISDQFASPAITVMRAPEVRSGSSFYLRVAANLGSVYPYVMKRHRAPELKAELHKLVHTGRCNLIVCDTLESAVNLDYSLPVPKVLYHHAVETALWQQRYETASGILRKSYFNFETKRMAAYETATANRFDLVMTTTAANRQTLISEHKVTTPISVVPVGVDCSYFKPGKVDRTVSRRIMFSGSLDLLSNVDQLLWFVAEVYPLVRREFPDVSLEIVGPRPAVEISALPEKDPSIKVTGWVKDVRPHLEQADVYIVPLQVRGGTRVKLYEAMAMRRPVVSTGYGAEGLQVVAGQHLRIADNATEFGRAIIELFRDPARKAEIAEAGWRLVNQSHDWRLVIPQALETLRNLALKPAAAGK